MAQRYPSEANLPVGGEISNTMLYGILSETRRELYERLDRHAERTDGAVSDIHSGINDIKVMLADGQEKFGRLDERIKGETTNREGLTRRVSDLESDVSKLPRALLNGSGKTKEESGANRMKIEKDLRVKIVNAIIIAAAAVLGTAFGGWVVKGLALSTIADQRSSTTRPEPDPAPPATPPSHP